MCNEISTEFVCAQDSSTQTIGSITICGEHATIQITLHYLRRVFLVEPGRVGGTAYAIAAEIGSINTFFIQTSDTSRMKFVGLAVKFQIPLRLITS